MEFIISASTDIGVKRKNNEDSLYVCRLGTNCGNMVFAVMCDGMGGLSHGACASATVVDAFVKWMRITLPVLLRRDIPDHMIKEQWLSIIDAQNSRLRAYGSESGALLGTTAATMLLTEKHYYILNIGDSRIYEITDGVRQITTDHSLVAREVALGNLTTQQATLAPQQNVLTQCVGGSEDAAEPDVYFGEPRAGAVYMLCSDGLRHMVSPEEIYNFFRPSAMTGAAEMRGQEGALIACNIARGETDNISVVTIRTPGGDTGGRAPEGGGEVALPGGFVIAEEICYTQGQPLI